MDASMQLILHRCCPGVCGIINDTHGTIQCVYQDHFVSSTDHRFGEGVEMRPILCRLPRVPIPSTMIHWSTNWQSTFNHHGDSRLYITLPHFKFLLKNASQSKFSGISATGLVPPCTVWCRILKATSGPCKNRSMKQTGCWVCFYRERRGYDRV